MAFTDIDATHLFFRDAFPERTDRPNITYMSDGRAAISLEVGQDHLRPGGIVSGPTQMTMCDTVAYVCVFTRLGIVPMAVTSSLQIDFLRGCVGPTVRAEAELLKLGRTLAVIEVRVYGADDALSARASVTYAVPK